MTLEPYETFEVAGCTVSLYPDYDAGNPYDEWDQTSDILSDPRIGFGDPTPKLGAWNREDPSSAVMCRWLTLFGGYALAIPAYIADYGSGGWRAFLSTPDDEPSPAYLVLSNEAYAREFGAYGMPLTGDAEHTAEKTCRAEFETFAAWLEGDVSGYTIERDGELLDSCWGFYGPDSDKYAREEAIAAAEWENRERLVNQEPIDAAEVFAYRGVIPPYDVPPDDEDPGEEE